MRVLLVSHGVTDQSMLGGPGRVAASQANALVEAGNRVSIVTTDVTAKGERTPAPTFGLLDSRVDVHCIPGRSWRRWPGTIGPILHLNSKTVLRRAVGEADVVHCHEWPHQLVHQARKIASEMGKPCLIQPHGSIQPRRGLNRLKHAAVARRYPPRTGEVFIAGTASEEAEIRAAFGADPRIVRIVNPMVLPTLDASDTGPKRVRESWGFPTRNPVVLYAHRVFPNKGLDLLIQSLRLLPDFVDLAIVGVIGDARFAAECFSLISQHGLNHRARYFGPVDRDQLDDVIRASDIFVLPARRDTFPLMVLNAMACAKPVVVTNTCQSVELFGSAVAVTEPSPEAIARTIRPLLDQEERARLGARGRNLVKEEFGPDVVAAALESLYLSVL